MDPVVHFELPAEDRRRMANFYNRAFGWKTELLGEDMGNYVLVSTTDKMDENNMITEPGMINGGFYMKDPAKPAQYPSIVIGVQDLDAAMRKIRDAGGEVLGEPVEIPGYGTYVSFYDTEKNRISIMEPSMPMKDNENSF
jgi:predicted enzyme related to lactoylglutathione lyase